MSRSLAGSITHRALYTVTTASPSDGGTGYHVGDIIRPLTNRTIINARLRVEEIDDEDGAVTDLSVIRGGIFLLQTVATLSTTDETGTGTGCTAVLSFNLI